MSTRHLRRWLLVLAWAVQGQPVAAELDAETQARERIAQERLVIERDAKAAQAACAKKFAVTDCVNRVKAERRERLQPLDRELAALDDALRERRAAERLSQLLQRQAAQSEERPQASMRASAPAGSAAASSAKAPRRSAEAAIAAKQAAASQAEITAAQRAAAAVLRNEQAEAHRRADEERNQKRAAQRAPAAPLPLPPAPAASR
jgi:hypothetical protein